MGLLFTGCTQTISEIKSQDYVGKEVVIKGTIENTIKLGDLSGYTLSDEKDSIFISSQELPKEGDTKKVKGILMKNILGYYIQTN